MSDSTKKILIFLVTSIAASIIISLLFTSKVDSSNIKIAEEYLKEREKEGNAEKDSSLYENETIPE